MQVVVRKHLLRRTKESKLDGKPILELKPKHIEVEYVEFSAEERQVWVLVINLKTRCLLFVRFLRQFKSGNNKPLANS